MADPITNIVACQFSIPIDDFEFGIGNLAGPDLPGLASLMTGFIEAFIEAMVPPIEPVQFIIDAAIFDLLDWISTALSDFPGFLEDLFVMKVVDPFTAKLKVYFPEFDIDLGLFSVTVPELNGPPEPPFTNDEWLPVQGFIKLFIGLLKMPFNVLKGIIDYIIDNLSIPVVNKPFLVDIWEAILISLGFTGIPLEAVTKLGECFMDELLALVPALIADNGGTGLPDASAGTDPITVDVITFTQPAGSTPAFPPPNHDVRTTIYPNYIINKTVSNPTPPPPTININEVQQEVVVQRLAVNHEDEIDLNSILTTINTDIEGQVGNDTENLSLTGQDFLIRISGSNGKKIEDINFKPKEPSDEVNYSLGNNSFTTIGRTVASGNPNNPTYTYLYNVFSLQFNPVSTGEKKDTVIIQSRATGASTEADEIFVIKLKATT